MQRAAKVTTRFRQDRRCVGKPRPDRLQEIPIIKHREFDAVVGR